MLYYLTMTHGFADLLEKVLTNAPARTLAEGECCDMSGRRCSLCHASRTAYDRELPAKRLAFNRFWAQHQLPGPVPELMAASPGRDYRFSSRRRVFVDSGKAQLAMVELEEGKPLRPFIPLRCRLEPAAHGLIYSLLRSELGSARYPRLRLALLHVVLKGPGDSPGVVLSLTALDSQILREANRLSKTLTAHFPDLTGVWIHRHSGGKGYALGSAAGIDRSSWRKIYGRSAIAVEIPGGKLRFSPLCFTQSHPRMIAPLLRSAEELLPKSAAGRLLDLYSGYGLFALHLQRNYRQVWGLEGSLEAVRWAQDNARRMGAAHVRFRQADIQPDSLAAVLPAPAVEEDILLDPPRSGPPAHVIRALAARRPRRVLHICCDVERIPVEIQDWAKQGYRLAGARCLDMFPGVPAVETLLLFLPD